ncbi:MAG: metalloregulator ArsR/SmtB family transcription factor [Planctomycetota bacterium]
MKTLSDRTRLRILSILTEHEVTVGELQEILSMGQSRISGHLAMLREAGLIQERREGKRVYSSLRTDAELGTVWDGLRRSVRESHQGRADLDSLKNVLRARREEQRAYFDRAAESFGKQYLPGRTWESLAKALLLLVPRQVVADLGVGSGELTLLLASAAQRVIAVDYSEKMLQTVATKALRAGLSNIEFRSGEIDALPLAEQEVDVVILSQVLHHADSPARALDEAHRVLKPGGRVIVLDLRKHQEAWVRDKLKDVWLGFNEDELLRLMKQARFAAAQVTITSREPRPPYFKTVLATGIKGQPGASSTGELIRER